MKIRVVAGSSRAARVARAVGLASALWGQRGLGTLYLALRRLPRMTGTRCEVEFEAGCNFELDPLEPYWAPTIIGGRPYEPEVRQLLLRLATLDPVLVDCGANFGYWSIVATGPQLRFTRAVAIEASPSTHAALVRNAALNGGRFVCLHRAVAARSGDDVLIDDTRGHAVASVSPRGRRGSRVVTISTADAVRAAGWEAAGSFVLKVDVEGLEVDAVEGWAPLAATDHVFVLEDWVARDYPTLRALLTRGYEAFYITASGQCERLASPEEARRAARRDGLESRAQNLVFTRGRGPLATLIRDWARASQ